MADRDFVTRDVAPHTTRRRLGFKVSRGGIYIGCPRLLDIDWYGGRLTFRTYKHVLRLSLTKRPFVFARSLW